MFFERDLRQYELYEEDWKKINEICIVLKVSFFLSYLFILAYILIKLYYKDFF